MAVHVKCIKTKLVHVDAQMLLKPLANSNT